MSLFQTLPPPSVLHQTQDGSRAACRLRRGQHGIDDERNCLVLIAGVRDSVSDDLASWIAVVISLFGGGYTGVRAGAFARMHLEDRRALYDVLVSEQEAMVAQQFEVVLSQFQIPGSDEVMRLSAEKDREISHLIGMLPFFDRLAWAKVKAALDELQAPTDISGNIAHARLADSARKELGAFRTFLLWQLRPSWSHRWRRNLYRVRLLWWKTQRTLRREGWRKPAGS